VGSRTRVHMSGLFTVQARFDSLVLESYSSTIIAFVFDNHTRAPAVLRLYFLLDTSVGENAVRARRIAKQQETCRGTGLFSVSLSHAIGVACYTECLH
jgi:hypothetical protein